jgi:photosystem II stability/assembly factor-like uncharacterized protein
MESNTRRARSRLAVGALVVALLCCGLAAPTAANPGAAATDPILRPAEPMPRAIESLILDLAISGTRRIAVGERGHVLLSDDGREWRQVADVPTRATLTSVAARGDDAWAVGHDGVIIRSRDGGRTWRLVHSNPYVAGSNDPHNGVPLLDVLFIDANRGFAIGAYALMLRTDDGGETWTGVALPKSEGMVAAEADDAALTEGEDDDSWLMDADELSIDEEADPHLNAMARLDDGTLFMVAERGAGYRSIDGGETWERRTLPYDGSMFGLLAFESSRLLAFGLRGNALESMDGGLSWIEVDTGTPLSLFGGAALANGGAVLVGANGVVVSRGDAEQPFSLTTFVNDRQESPILAAIVAEGDNRFIVSGDRGIGVHRAE